MKICKLISTLLFINSCRNHSKLKKRNFFPEQIKLKNKIDYFDEHRDTNKASNRNEEGSMKRYLKELIKEGQIKEKIAFNNGLPSTKGTDYYYI